jgi:hypothetical protein
MTTLLIAALSLQLNLGTVAQHGKTRAPRPTCHIETVAYRFVGAAGSRFVYDGETFVMPAKGSIELIADKRATEYRVADRSLPLNVWPRDEFGIRTVSLPSAANTAPIQ